MNNARKQDPTKTIHPLINMLAQLQELSLVRSEQDATSQENHMEQLDLSIKTLTEQLPIDIRTLFLKCQKKDPLAIVPISNNVCCGCGLALPIALVYAVRACEKLYQCTNCARMLYYPEVRPRRVSHKQARRSEPRRAGIARFSSLSLMIPALKGVERDDAIAELALRMEHEKFVDNGAKLVEEALQREAILNTAVDYGLAFPHVRGVEGGGLTLALGISRKGINFEPGDKTLTHIIFFIVIPTAASVFYLKLLAGLTQTFSKKDARDKLIACKTPEELWATLTKSTKQTIV